MRELARASVRAAENALKFPRLRWELDDQPTDEAVVIFYLEEAGQGGDYLYHAMVEGEVAFYGSVDEIPREFMSEDNIKFFFGVDVETFCSKGFLDTWNSD